ncbi:hypothetical protein [Longimicrobium sp.]|uniref:hypothetical protein n=1 Tax=Longimicrobium sp. TaxID=2029185 RepID=UPI002E3760CD|nr:hypothetical protein [Longimicrobium sp.]HEX6036924.1 hypothetical protein [Longimicrobium sp.]
MARIILTRVSGFSVGACLLFGIVAVMEQPSSAQITEKCWREYCVYDPEIKGDRCIREQIACPPQT